MPDDAVAAAAITDELLVGVAEQALRLVRCVWRSSIRSCALRLVRLVWRSSMRSSTCSAPDDRSAQLRSRQRGERHQRPTRELGQSGEIGDGVHILAFE